MVWFNGHVAHLRKIEVHLCQGQATMDQLDRFHHTEFQLLTLQAPILAPNLADRPVENHSQQGCHPPQTNTVPDSSKDGRFCRGLCWRGGNPRKLADIDPRPYHSSKWNNQWMETAYQILIHVYN